MTRPAAWSSTSAACGPDTSGARPPSLGRAEKVATHRRRCCRCLSGSGVDASETNRLFLLHRFIDEDATCVICFHEDLDGSRDGLARKAGHIVTSSTFTLAYSLWQRGRDTARVIRHVQNPRTKRSLGYGTAYRRWQAGFEVTFGDAPCSDIFGGRLVQTSQIGWDVLRPWAREGRCSPGNCWTCYNTHYRQYTDRE